MINRKNFGRGATEDTTVEEDAKIVVRRRENSRVNARPAGSLDLESAEEEMPLVADFDDVVAVVVERKDQELESGDRGNRRTVSTGAQFIKRARADA